MTCQIWACSSCSHQRIYGNSDAVPSKLDRRALIACEKPCSLKPTWHEYRRSTTRSTWDGYVAAEIPTAVARA